MSSPLHPCSLEDETCLHQESLDTVTQSNNMAKPLEQQKNKQVHAFKPGLAPSNGFNHLAETKAKALKVKNMKCLPSFANNWPLLPQLIYRITKNDGDFPHSFQMLLSVAEVQGSEVINEVGSSIKCLKDHKNSSVETFSLLHQGHKSRLYNLRYWRGLWEMKHIFQEPAWLSFMKWASVYCSFCYAQRHLLAECCN